MSKELRTKKEGLVKQLNALNEKLKTEGRASFSPDEKAAFDKLKTDLAGISEVLGSFEIEEAEAKAEAERALKNPVKRNTEDTFKTFLKSARNGETFSFSMDEFEKRATVTTTTNGQFKFTDMNEGVSVNEPELVLESLGAKVAFFAEGNVAYPSLGHITGSWGAEDLTVNDQVLTTASQILVPTFVSASIEVSRAFVTQSKKKNIDDLKNALVLAVKKAVEKQALKTLTGTTAGSTTGTSFQRAVDAESRIVGAGNGCVAGVQAVKRMKQEKIDAGSGIMTWTNNEVNGYAAKRSILTPTTSHVFYGDFSSVVLAYFGDNINISIVEDSAMARKGNYLIIASAMADAKCIDANKMVSFIAG